MPGTGVCLAVSLCWFGGRNCRRALPTRWLGKTEVWLAPAAGSKDASASEQGAAGQASSPATGMDAEGEAQAWGQRVQIFPCLCPAICDAGLFFFFKSPFDGFFPYELIQSLPVAM